MKTTESTKRKKEGGKDKQKKKNFFNYKIKWKCLKYLKKKNMITGGGVR